MIVTIIADDYSLINGGVEHHAKVMLEKFVESKHKAIRISYNNIFSKYVQLQRSDLVVFEGIRRVHLLFLFLFENRLLHKLIIFTHGSFMYYTRRGELKKTGYFNSLIPFWTLFDYLITGLILRKVARVITLSEAEKKELIYTFKLPDDQVKVLDNFVLNYGSDSTHEQAFDPSNTYSELIESKKPYVCTVSRIDKRKNIVSAVIASQQVNLNYILAGKDQGGLKRILKVVRRLSINNFTYIGKISDMDKFILIKNSIGYLQTSYFEMVPFSVYEALSLGKPVLLTKLSYIGDLPHIVKCYSDVSSIREGLNKLTRMSKLEGTYDIEEITNLKTADEIFSEFMSFIRLSRRFLDTE